MMVKLDRSRASRQHLHRNELSLADLNVWLMLQTFGFVWAFIAWANCKKSFIKPFFEYLMGHLNFSLKLPKVCGAVDAYCLLLAMHIRNSPVFSLVDGYLRVTFASNSQVAVSETLAIFLGPECWNHKLGAWTFGLEGAGCFSGAVHRATRTTVRFPLGLSVPWSRHMGARHLWSSSEIKIRRLRS